MDYAALAAEFGGVPGKGKDANSATTKRRDLAQLAAEFGGVPASMPDEAPMPDMSPTAGMSGTEKVLSGIGKAFTDLPLGMKQIQAELGSRGIVLPGMPPLDRGSYAKLAFDLKKEATDKKTADKPLLETGGGMAGNLIGQVIPAMAMLPAGAMTGGARFAGAPLLDAALSGAVQGAVQPVAEDDSRSVSAGLGALGGTAGQALAKGVGFLTQKAAPTVNSLADKARSQGVSFLESIGAPTTLGQMAGNPLVQRLERVLSMLPGSSGYYRKVNAEQSSALNKAVDDMIGDTSSRYAALSQNAPLKLDADFFDALRAIPDKFKLMSNQESPGSAFSTINEYVGRSSPNPILAKLGPNARAQAIAQGIPATVQTTPAKLSLGQQIPFAGGKDDFNNYQALRSYFGDLAENAGNGADKAAFKSIQKAFDDVADRAVGPKGAADLADLRSAYTVQSILKKAAIKNRDGDIEGYDLLKVRNAIRNTDNARDGMFDRMAGDRGSTLREVRNAIDTIQPINSSGTAENTMAMKLATMGMLSGTGVGAGVGAWLGGPEDALKYGVGLGAAPFAMKELLRNRALGSFLSLDRPMMSNALQRLGTSPEGMATTLSQLLRSGSAAGAFETLP